MQVYRVSFTKIIRFEYLNENIKPNLKKKERIKILLSFSAHKRKLFSRIFQRW